MIQDSLQSTLNESVQRPSDQFPPSEDHKPTSVRTARSSFSGKQLGAFLGVLSLVVIAVGAAGSVFLMSTNQDIRQQAAAYCISPGNFCGTGSTGKCCPGLECKNNTCQTAANTPILTQKPSIAPTVFPTSTPGPSDVFSCVPGTCHNKRWCGQEGVGLTNIPCGTGASCRWTANGRVGVYNDGQCISGTDKRCLAGKIIYDEYCGVVRTRPDLLRKCSPINSCVKVNGSEGLWCGSSGYYAGTLCGFGEKCIVPGGTLNEGQCYAATRSRCIHGFMFSDPSCPAPTRVPVR